MDPWPCGTQKNVLWGKVSTNLGDNIIKNHAKTYCQIVIPIYTHEFNSPRIIPRDEDTCLQGSVDKNIIIPTQRPINTMHYYNTCINKLSNTLLFLFHMDYVYTRCLLEGFHMPPVSLQTDIASIR